MNIEYMRQRFEESLILDWENRSDRTRLHSAIEYALQSGGKRYRPIIVLSVAQALGNENDVMPSALAVEYFHTASLIADDLPCMDNDNERRGKPALHIQYDETTALLASYGLICAAFEKIQANAKLMPNEDKLGSLAIEQAARAAGVSGATGGQYLDIFPPKKDIDTLIKILQLKTVTLFETAFVLGWLFGGGDGAMLDKVRSVAGHFGLAFQIADDLKDYAQDIQCTGSPNLAVELGKKRAEEIFHSELSALDKCMDELSLHSPELDKLCCMLAGYGVATSF